ncbi:iron chaperone [Salipaludibacillus keqinensis]|uniref:Iron chaperone n=2 Tax=Salipaludibacillus keqinensis TaxID=2045207 RepID=A0A323THN5_9BACI|nr:iron chaperone [Salipaludibacillus keqinensis]
MEELLTWVMEKFPSLEPEIAWNQPMFTDHATYIIGFSVAKHHLSVAPERAGLDHFKTEIEQAGYDYTKELVRMKWNTPIDFTLIEKMIELYILDKKDYSTLWRK